MRMIQERKNRGAGSLKAICGIRFPTDWQIALSHFENIATEREA